jgi:FkbM family methyltransferase
VGFKFVEVIVGAATMGADSNPAASNQRKRPGAIRRLASNLGTYRELFGWSGVLIPARVRLPFLSTEFRARPPGIATAVVLRAGENDLAPYGQVFHAREYELDFARAPRTVIDAGANLGFASLYFANRHPDARIVAIEAEASNFALLRRNVAPYGNVTPVHAALWDEESTVRVVESPYGSWGFRTSADVEAQPDASDTTVRATTVPALMRDHGLESVDLLKVDIEGAEKRLFDDSAGWIDRVGVVIAELHDWLVPGAAAAFDAATAGFDEHWERGEHRIAARQGRLRHGRGRRKLEHADR